MRTISVAIPAFNEESTIAACLESLLAQRASGRMAVVVAANGCSDSTSEQARRFRDRFASAGHSFRVIELDERSKPQALNAAEEILPPSPRVYLDADVTLSPDAVAVMSEALRSGVCHLCAPRLEVESRSFLVRGYARIWQALPAVRHGVIGAGVLAVSEAGRRRWQRFPEIVADDGFIERHFVDSERRVLPGVRCVIRFPERLADLVAMRSRWRRGRLELDRAHPHLTSTWRTSGLLKAAAWRPDLWPVLPLYVSVNALAGIRARAALGTSTQTWEPGRRR